MRVYPAKEDVMSEQFPDVNPVTRPEMSAPGPEASSCEEADGGGAERSRLERSDRLRSGAEPPSAAPAPCEASPRSAFAGPAPQAYRSEPHEQDVGPAARNGAHLPGLVGRRRGGPRVVKPVATPDVLTPEQRLLLLFTWKRSGLPAGDFAAMVGIIKHS